MRAILKAICVAVVAFGASPDPAFADKEIPPLPQWMELCGPDFVTFVGRRWLLTSNAKDKTKLLDAVNFWTVQKRSILSVRAFRYEDTLRAFVALGLGKHRMSLDGNPIDIVISFDGYRLLMSCLAEKAR